jgi:hypothetical protein
MRWYNWVVVILLVAALLPAPSSAQPIGSKASQGNRLAYLDEDDPYYVGRTFPKLTTPMWVGEKGVEAVVVLAIDDMKDHKPYEAFLRPILNRLKKIDGRAPVSIMTCSIDPKESHLQKWLKEGVSLEVHTYDHPCPFFKGGFAKAKETYDKCVDLMASIPGNKPVAFRMPCCDSLNTPSPRFWAEIFNKKTAKGNFLALDSSVFNVFTSDDPDLPRELVQEPDGTERFRKYLPKDRTFVNTIENYPYPYVIGKLCWQFPCVTPSDWQAQHFHNSNNPKTLEDWKHALEATVIKQGVFNLVFHPHGWIKNDQIVDLIDYAVTKYGKRVKFLNFKEAEERLTKNLLAGQAVRDPKTGKDNGVRLLDIDNDGFLDVFEGNVIGKSRIWSPAGQKWNSQGIEQRFGTLDIAGWTNAVRFGILNPNGYSSILIRGQFPVSYRFDGSDWLKQNLFKGLQVEPLSFPQLGALSALIPDAGVRLRDIDGDGICELVVGHAPKTPSARVWAEQPGIYKWSAKGKMWEKLPMNLPGKISIVDQMGNDNGVRFIDLNGDGHLDIVYSNEKEYGVYLFKDMKTGWSQKLIAGKAGDKDALPPITIKGANNGMWVHSGSLWWSNESTLLLKDHVDRVSFKELLGKLQPKASSPQS